MANEELIQQIITGDLQTLWNLLCIYRDEDEHLQTVYEQAKNGYTIHYHINYLLQNRYDDRLRAQEIALNGKIYNDTDWWDEEETRTSTIRKALLEHFMTDNKPYDPR